MSDWMIGLTTSAKKGAGVVRQVAAESTESTESPASSASSDRENARSARSARGVEVSIELSIDDNEVDGDDRDVNAETANGPTEVEPIDPNADVVDSRPIAQRATRSRRRKELILACSDFRVSDALRYMSMLAHGSLCSFLATADTLL